MSNPLLRDHELKWRRAMKRSGALRESVERFSNVERKPVRGDYDRDAGKYFFDVPLEPIDPEWTLLLGEFVYNTRASLNYLVTALVRSTGKEENEGHEFPIYGTDRDRWRAIDQWWEADPDGAIRRKLKDTPSGTKAALKTLQPFYGVPRTDPHGHPLTAVQVLSNTDKHRRLNLLARGAVVDFVDAGGKPIFDGPPAQVGRIAEPDEGNAYTASLATHERDVDVYLLPAYNVRLHEPPKLFGGLIETLTGVNEFIDRRVVPTIKALI